MHMEIVVQFRSKREGGGPLRKQDIIHENIGRVVPFFELFTFFRVRFHFRAKREPSLRHLKGKVVVKYVAKFPRDEAVFEG